MKLVAQTDSGKFYLASAVYWVDASTTQTSIDSAIVKDWCEAARLALAREKYTQFFISVVNIDRSVSVGAAMSMNDDTGIRRYHIGHVQSVDDLIAVIERQPNVASSKRPSQQKIIDALISFKLDGRPYVVENRTEGKYTSLGIGDSVVDPLTGRVVFTFNRNDSQDKFEYLQARKPAYSIWSRKNVFLRRVANFRRAIS